MSRFKLYSLLSAACLAGYVWLFWVLYRIDSNASGYSICLFKNITHLPCPSCGSSRSLIYLLQGELLLALYYNPLGYVIGGILAFMPIWIMYDVTFQKETLYQKYNQMEACFKKTIVYIPFALLILFNWIWTIYKNI